jgi:galactokinase
MMEETFRKIYGADPEVVARAPGRVNLIGEHTDYNDGFVLPAALDRAIQAAGRRRAGRIVRLHAADLGESIEFSLDSNAPDAAHPWSNYFRGVARLLEAAGHRLAGADVAVGGDVPREAGLSSSAAMEVATAAFWDRLLGLNLEPVFAAQLAQRAENGFVGMPCGIMDQFASALGRRGHALFLDCRDLSYRLVPLPADFKIVVCNSGVKRALAQSEYAVRRRQCRQAVEQMDKAGLAVRSLRDVETEELEAARGALDELLLRRARHVVSENRRVREAVRALEAGDAERLGQLMNASHDSLRDDYEVSLRELDTLVELAQRQRGCYGARLTGAGFGGCTVNLVRAEEAPAFAEAVRDGYKQAMGLEAEIYICQASDGAFAN